MNFLFAKLSQNYAQLACQSHLRGEEEPTLEGPSPPGYNLVSKRIASSCRTWERYLHLLANSILIEGILNSSLSELLCILTVAWALKSLV